MKNIYIYTLLSLFSLNCLILQAQRSTYYYNNKTRVDLIIDYSRISIVSKGELSKEKINDKISKTDYSINLRLKNNRNISPIYKTTSDILLKDEDITVSEIVFPMKKDILEYNEYIQNLQSDPKIIKVSPTYLINNSELGISNEFYIKIKNEADIDLLKSLANKYKLDIMERNIYMPLWFTLSCTYESSLNVLDAANIFFESNQFECSEPEFVFKVDLHSADPFFCNQWGLKNTGQYGGTPGVDINIENAWTLTTGSPNIRVAVFDTGFDLNHPDLTDNADHVNWHNVSNPSGRFRTYDYHGTTCAGIIGAKKDNSIGVCGVAPNTKLVSISQAYNATPEMIAEGFNWARTNGVDIISCSWGMPQNSTIVNEAIQSALTFGRDGKGCVVVFSVGNNDADAITYPANSNPLILAVGAISPCGDRKTKTSCDSMVKWGSNWGLQLDIVAPGTLISTTDAVYDYSQPSDVLVESVGFNYENQWPYYSYGGTKVNFNDYSDCGYSKRFFGTSAACPFVAGVAALLLSKEPNLTVQQVNNAIESTATKLNGSYYELTTGRNNGPWGQFTGYGLVNAYAALQSVCNKRYEGEVVNNDTEYEGCQLTFFDFWIKNQSNVKITANETIIESDLEVELGSTLEITNH
jgi:subtilisin family serine protease